MANWNLSVDIRGTGNSLATDLESAAKHARTLGTASKTAKTEVKGLGVAAEAAGKHIRTLGREAQTAGRHLGTLGQHAATVSRNLTRYGSSARTANQQLNSLGGHSRTAGRDLARMSGQVTTAVRDLTRLAAAARTADARLNRVGNTSGLRRVSEETSRLKDSLKSLVGLGATLGLTLGLHEVLKEGNEYQQEMNAFGAVTGASKAQMQLASATANQLGNDLKLPAATAGDAAEAMVELAKAGFRTNQAISSTRASLVLASAAQVSAANSAKYLGDIMDQFGMGADSAGKAADILAATSNSASGNITDIYYAMKYAGPVAHGLGVSMQETASAVGMLGKAGILGQTAGTTLRGMLANLAAPTKQMKEGLSDLGIEAWDAQGNFKGLRVVIDGLAKAEHRMSQKDFAAAVKKSMGKPAMSGAIAMAHQGVDSFDNLMMAVNRSGAATDIAAAKGKGLAGAMLQLRTQAKQTGLTIYNGMAPSLEWLTRGLTSGLSKATPKIQHFFDYFNSAASLFGPDISAAVHRELSSITNEAKGLSKPFKHLGGQALADFLHILLSIGQAGVSALKNLVGGIEPVVHAFGDLSGKSGAAASMLDTAATAIDYASRAASFLTQVLVPIGHIVGTLVSTFGDLPGPVQQFVLAALLARRIAPIFGGLNTRIRGTVGSVRSLTGEWQAWRSAAGTTGATMTRLGASFAMLESRSAVVSRMGTAFRTASAQGTGFTGTLRGIGAASGVVTRSLGSGLIGALGGGWGVAITAATVGLGFLAKKQQEAAQAAAEHRERISSLSEALRESNGVVDKSVRAVAAQNIMQSKAKDWYGTQQRLVDLATKAKVPMSDLVDAYTNQGSSLKELQTRLADVIKTHKVWSLDAESGVGSEGLDLQGQAAQALSDGLSGVSGDFKKALADAKAYNQAVNGTGDGVTAYDRLKTAVGELADRTGDADTRTRGLRDALDLLSGGSVSLQAAQARVNEAITQANEALEGGAKRADGYGKALLNANGTINTATKNGQSLFATFNTIADGASSAAVAAYDFAQSQGKGLPESLGAAKKQMKSARDSAVKLAEGYGLSAKEAGKVADSLGLIPGQVAILLSTHGVDSTLADLLAVQAEFQKVPKSKTIKVNSLSTEAKKDLEDLGYKIELIPGTREYKITAPTKDARTQLDLLVSALSNVPDGKDVDVDAKTAVAIGELNGLNSAIKKTPNAKSITVKALSAEAISALRAVGLKATTLPNGKVKVTAANGQALGAIGAVASALNNLDGKNANTYITTTKVTKFTSVQGGQTVAKRDYADGGVVDYYADGGIQRGGVRHFAGGSENHVAQIAPAGSWRVWGEPETQGEGYVPFASSKRPRSRAITEEIVRRLGGDPGGIVWNADGNVLHFASGGAADFTYTPTGGMKSTSDVQSSYSDAHQPIDKDDYNKKIRARANAVDTLRAAEARLAKVRRGKHTHAQLVAAETAVAKARRSLATATDAAAAAEARYKKKFSLSDWGKTLTSAVKSNKAYEANLNKIASRGGADVIDQLRDMGAEGATMVAALAKASNKQFNDIVSNLKKLGPLAKATLSDYTKQLTAATKGSATFQANLAKLAAMGYGALASQLAAQGDDAAEKLAADAVKSKADAKKANDAAKKAKNTLSQEQTGELVQIIAAISSSKTGIHDVAGKTGLGEDEIITVANLAKSQISKVLGSRATRFLADLGKANKHLAYADGGIRAGMYATSGGIIRFAEPETHGEAYLPLSPSKRRKALPVLADVAHRFGVGLQDASATRPIVIVRDGDTTNVSVTAVRTGATASDIGAQVGRSVRRARRGGVAARAA
ncbi:phage tail tape measure protein (plasmid) [Streptomyces seoulensis]|nr:phage tail tape measure protein [Streptomyces seoulensis]